MTFSEDDLLPYKKIKFERTPEYLKTVFMQWTMLEPIMQEHGGFVLDIHPDKLSSMSLLDMGANGGDSDGFLYAPTDFSSGFEQAVKDNELEDKRREERQAELKPLLVALGQPNNAATKAQVEKLINEELRTTTVPEATWIKGNIRTKVSTFNCLTGLSQYGTNSCTELLTLTSRL